MAYLCLGIGPTKKQQAFIYVKIHILRVHFLGTSLMSTMSKTSVSNTENGIQIRKSTGEQRAKLPYQTLKTGLRYGSRQGSREQNFRIKHRKQASNTEVAELSGNCPSPSRSKCYMIKTGHLLFHFTTRILCNSRYFEQIAKYFKFFVKYI